MNTSTVKAIIRAFNTASEEEHRLNLCGVLLKRGPGINEVEAISTTGHTLSINNVHDEEAYELIGNSEYFIDRYLELPLLKLVLKDCKRLPGTVSKRNDDGTLTIGLPGLIQCTLRTAKEKGIVFPDYRAVIPNTEHHDASISFNAEYLLSIFKALDKEEVRSKAVTISFNSKEKHSAIMCRVQDQAGVLMPMRL